MDYILKLKEVVKMTGLSRSIIYNEIKKGRFPRQVQRGPAYPKGRGRVGWRYSEVQAWIAALPYVEEAA